MAELRLGEIAAKTGGTILQGSPDAVFTTYTIDSRQATSGELFFAIVATRDGHDFVLDAAAHGAKGAVVSRFVAAPDPSFALVRVADTGRALRDLAAVVLIERKIKVVGITGSTGKTTTKEFAAALLAPRFRVHKSEGNFNNQLGLALSVLKIEPNADVAVLEMGMSGPGEIRALTAVAPPDVAVITNIAPVHLEFLKTMENIAAAKKEILAGSKPGGIAVLNGDDPYSERIAQGWAGRKVYFGLSQACDIRAEKIQRLGYEGFALDLVYGRVQRRIKVPFLADYVLYDLLAALGVAASLDIPFADLEDALHGLRLYARRGTLLRLERGIMVIDDSYNSNPRALESALRNFAALSAKRKVAVLGDMLELGESAAYFHTEAGAQAARAGWNLLITIGPLGFRIAEGARGAGMAAANILSFPTSEVAKDVLPGLLREGDLVLVKGSRGIRTDLVVEAFKEALKEK